MLVKTIENLCNFATTAISEIKTVLIKILDRYISASLCTQHQLFTAFKMGLVSSKYKSLRALISRDEFHYN